jgi:hypothetical protein
MSNALFGGMAFPVLGPALGLLYLFSQTQGSLFHPALLFFFIAAYAFALPSALVAGFVYWLAMMAVATALRLERVSALLAAALGCLASLVGMGISQHVVIGSFMPVSNVLAELSLIAAGSGVFLAVTTNLIAPVGTGSARSTRMSGA